MLTISIPGRGDLVLRHLLLDYNGTIAEDGHLAEGVAQRVEALSRLLEIYVVTADTHGTAAAACAGVPVRVTASHVSCSAVEMVKPLIWAWV